MTVNTTTEDQCKWQRLGPVSRTSKSRTVAFPLSSDACFVFPICNRSRAKARRSAASHQW